MHFTSLQPTTTCVIYTLSLHDALPICNWEMERRIKSYVRWNAMAMVVNANRAHSGLGGHISTYASAATLYEVAFNHFRSEEHTSELQSHSDIVCRLLLEKKKKTTDAIN